MTFTTRKDLAGKMAALFILLKSGKITEKQAKKATAPSTNMRKTKVNTSEKNHQKTNSDGTPIEGPLSNQAFPIMGRRPNLHIDLQIHLSPELSFEQIDKIFASMAKHLYEVDSK